MFIFSNYSDKDLNGCIRLFHQYYNFFKKICLFHGLYQCQFPGFAIVLKLCKLLILRETGRKVHRISPYSSFHVPVNIQLFKNKAF